MEETLYQCTLCKKDKKPYRFTAIMRRGGEPLLCDNCRWPKPRHKLPPIASDEKEIMRECLCGCGKKFLTTKSIRFINGHRSNSRVVIHELKV